jgi:hypothetical protein
MPLISETIKRITRKVTVNPRTDIHKVIHITLPSEKNNAESSWIIVNVFKDRVRNPCKLGFPAWWCMLIKLEETFLKIFNYFYVIEILQYIEVECHEWESCSVYLRVKIRVIATLRMFLQVPAFLHLARFINPKFEIFASVTLITDIIVHKDDKKKLYLYEANKKA